MGKYVCKRDGVCAGGLLIRWDNVCNDDKSSLELLSDKFLAFKYKSGRAMLFNINDDGTANDLIYKTSINYPILDLSDNIDKQFIINKYVCIDKLLKYLGYGVDLSQGDLNQIYKLLIVRNKWLKHNKQLFGYEDAEEYLSKKIYDNLEYVSLMSGRPHKEEPGYKLIKRK